MMKQLKSVLAILSIGIVVVAFFWIAKNFGGGESVQSEKPLVICQPQNAPPEEQKCNWTVHIHAHVRVFKGSQEVSLGFEQGELEEAHTHAGENKIHWHGLIPADPLTKGVKDWSPLQVGNLPKELKLSIDGNPKFFVNGKEVDLSYIWQDGDIIEMRYE